MIGLQEPWSYRRQGTRRLTPEQRAEIVAEARRGIPTWQVAQAYGITEAHVKTLVREAR